MRNTILLLFVFVWSVCGYPGYEADKAQREWMMESTMLPVEVTAPAVTHAPSYEPAPYVPGYEADKAQREWMMETAFQPIVIPETNTVTENTGSEKKYDTGGILGLEGDLRERDWMMDIAFAEPPEVQVTPDYSLIFSYSISNQTDTLVSSLEFQHNTSTRKVKVKTDDGYPKYWQNKWLCFWVHGHRNAGKNKWEEISARSKDLFGNSVTDTHIKIDVPVRGVDDDVCAYTGGKVYLTVKWEDGRKQRYLLPYPVGDIKVYEDSLVVSLRLAGKAGFASERERLFPLD